jgi:hypothetical protein
MAFLDAYAKNPYGSLRVLSRSNKIETTASGSRRFMKIFGRFPEMAHPHCASPLVMEISRVLTNATPERSLSRPRAAALLGICYRR